MFKTIRMMKTMAKIVSDPKVNEAYVTEFLEEKGLSADDYVDNAEEIKEEYTQWLIDKIKNS